MHYFLDTNTSKCSKTFKIIKVFELGCAVSAKDMDFYFKKT